MDKCVAGEGREIEENNGGGLFRRGQKDWGWGFRNAR